MDFVRAEYLYHHYSYDEIMEYQEFVSLYGKYTDVKCDYMHSAETVGFECHCTPSGCAHYGRCLPIHGIRETPKDAIGEHTAERGSYYHNLIAEGKFKCST